MLQFLHFLKSLLKVLKPSHKVLAQKYKIDKQTNRRNISTVQHPTQRLHPSQDGLGSPTLLQPNLIQNRRYPSSVLLYTPGELEEYYKRDMNRQEQTRINKNSREQTRIDKNGQEQTRIDKNRQEQARIDKNRQEQTRIDKIDKNRQEQTRIY